MRVGAGVVAICLVLGAVLPGAPGEARRDRGVIWLFLVDDLHIDFRTTGIVRAWLSSFVKDLIQQEDAFAARTTGPSNVSVGLLAGVADLEAGMRRVSGSGLKREQVQKIPEAAGEIVYRAKIALKAATEFLAIAPAHDPRRRIMLYIGKGFDADDPLSDEIQKLLTEAWRLDCTLIALDPSVLPGAQALAPHLPDAERLRGINARRGSLEGFALPTNGFVLADEASVRDAAARIAKAVR